MAGSTFGTIFRTTTWGESHGKALGAVIDGCPAGLPLSETDIQNYLDRRRPGRSRIATARKEKDEAEILSGVFEGHTTGASISLMVRNTGQISADYSELASCYRPGHADYTYDSKYGFRDYRGGGRSSGRETVGRVAAGAVAARLLESLGISVCAYTRSIGPVEADPSCLLSGREAGSRGSCPQVPPGHAETGHGNAGACGALPSWFDREAVLSTPTAMPDRKADEEALSFLENAMARGDSVGGCIECAVLGLPAGIGDPVFEKLDANLAKAVLSIGAVKAVEFGDGCRSAQAAGSANNDCYYLEDGEIRKATNHAGGVLGGISDGSPLILRAYVKPTPSICRPQQTVNKVPPLDVVHGTHSVSGEITLRIRGRHDPVIVPRAVVVVEAMAALTVLDALLLNMTARLDSVRKFYR
ncbi:MAG: chorismate synthase [Clostridium sp.]|jgi:chorismate synthase|nr:chorismate synthase [Clostridium sp.]